MTVDLLEALTSPRIWTLDDIDDLPDDGRYEIVDGRPYYVASPGRIHDYAAAQVIGRLLAAVPSTAAVLAGGGVGVDYFNFRIADTLVIRRDTFPSDDERNESRAHEIVLAVEVMSPSSKVTDRVTKPAQYAEAGIQHFWRFEPDEALLVAFGRPAGGRYLEIGRASGDTALTVTQPFPITIVPSSLLP